MSENPGSSSGAPRPDPESTQPAWSTTPISSAPLGAGLYRSRRASRRSIVLGCLLVLGMTIAGSALIFSALLPASDLPPPAGSDTSRPPTALPSLAVIQPTATRTAPAATPTPRPSNTPAATTRAATTVAPAEATPTSAPTERSTEIPTGAPTAGDDVSSDAAHDLLNRINQLRAQNNLSPYRLNSTLAEAALRHSQDMANTGRIDHTGSDGSTVKQRVRDAGYGNLPAGEIIFGGQVSLDDAWAFWSTDPPHLANLLSSRYNEMGVGIVTANNRTYYTVDFGAHPRK
jgi:uncharacterized protein YkwD